MHNPSRFCTRCHRELTDAASMEYGIGPDCRGLDNALLAKLYPSDLPKARTLFNAVDLTTVAPETLKTVNEVYAQLFADDAPSREDWRKEVKRIEWALSFPANNYLRSALTDVVAALGYLGLAALWNGEAKTGLAHVSFVSITVNGGYGCKLNPEGAPNRIVLQAAKCAAARVAFRNIKGARFHSENTLFPKAAWSFPAEASGAVYGCITKHYPNFEGLNDAVAQAEKFTQEMKVLAAKIAALKVPAKVILDMETHPVNPVAQQIAAQVIKPGVNIVTLFTSPPTVVKVSAPVTAPKCSIAKVGVLLKVQTPYKPEYVDDLKSSVKYTDRRWNSHERVWELPLMHEAKVQELVKKHFGAEAALLP